jgi:hypothetical protein
MGIDEEQKERILRVAKHDYRDDDDVRIDPRMRIAAITDSKGTIEGYWVGASIWVEAT